MLLITLLITVTRTLFTTNPGLVSLSYQDKCYHLNECQKSMNGENAIWPKYALYTLYYGINLKINSTCWGSAFSWCISLSFLLKIGRHLACIFSNFFINCFLYLLFGNCSLFLFIRSLIFFLPFITLLFYTMSHPSLSINYYFF